METTEYGERSRPIGVSVIAVLYVLGGIVGIFFGLAGGVVLSDVYGADVSTIVAGIFIAAGIAAFAIAYGLWKLKEWALWSAIILSALSIAGSVMSFMSTSIISIIISAIMIIYLFSNREAFGDQSQIS